MTFILGLTGGIASGKSTVTEFFLKKGFPIIDGDQIARDIVALGKPALKKIEVQFGPTILLPTGELNRQKLGALIFQDNKKRKILDPIMAPYLRKEITRQIEKAKQNNERLVIVDLPLLYEAGYDTLVTKVAVVYVDKAQQLKRLMQRNQLPEQQAMNRILSQMPLDEKRKKAEIIFDNTGTIDETIKQVENWLANQHLI